MNLIYRSFAVADDQWQKLNMQKGTTTAPALWGEGAKWDIILDSIVSMIFVIAGIVAFLYLIYSGFIYLTAGGNPDAAKKGQAGLLNSILGLVIIFLAYGIVRFVVSFLSS